MSTDQIVHNASADLTATRARHRPVVEFPTLFLIVAVYGGWLIVTRAYGQAPLALLAPIAVVLLTLHSSLQHEIVHGHPTRWMGVNHFLAVVPLSLWLPYERYHVLHRAHHTDARLTDPLDDPESFYWTRQQWASLSPLSRVFLRMQQTLAGRLFIGSWWRIGMFLRGEVRLLIASAPGVRGAWVEQLAWLVPIVFWLKFVCGMPLWIYVLTMVIPSHALLLIRSFAEHRATPAVRERIAIVEGSWILGPLYLFNNLHSLHHEAPAVPWYQYHGRYARIRERLLAENGGLRYNTYFDVARRFLFRSHDALEHPDGRVPPSAQREPPTAAA